MRVSDGVLDVVGFVADLRLRTRVWNQGIIRSFVLNHFGGKQKGREAFLQFLSRPRRFFFSNRAFS